MAGTAAGLLALACGLAGADVRGLDMRVGHALRLRGTNSENSSL